MRRYGGGPDNDADAEVMQGALILLGIPCLIYIIVIISQSI